MKKIFNLLNLCILSFAISVPAMAQSSKALYEIPHLPEAPFAMPKVAVVEIPDYTVQLTDFGAKGDGGSLCTEAFAAAMKALDAKGGGHLIVPSGIWLTGPIQFVSNVDLHVEQGALVLFTTDFDAYPEITTIYEGNTATKKMAPLYAYEVDNVAITGPGSFDGQGQAWRPSKKGKFTSSQWQSLTSGEGIEKGGIWYPNAKQDDMKGTAEKPDMRRVTGRPVLLEFVRCKNVLLKDATFSNSPAWNIHPLMCEDVVIDHVNIRNPWFAQNGDGLDLESCNRVLILNSTFDVGDDAICIKSGKNKEGRGWKLPCQNVIIDGCTVLHGHGGFVIGSEMSSGANNIYVHNCLFNGTDTGLRMKSTRGRGGVIENIYIDKINMVNISGDAFTFDLYYSNKPVGGKADKDSSVEDAVPPVTEETPCFKNLYISNVVCQGAKRAIWFNGLPEMPLENLQMRNSIFVADKGCEMHYAKDILFENVIIENKSGDRVKYADVTNFVEK
jgi:polygalacturonase